MPPDMGIPISPRPTHSAPSPQMKRGRAARWGSTLFVLLLLTFAFSAVSLEWSKRLTGEVTVLVRSADGTRSVETLSLSSGSLTPRTDIDPNSITTVSSRTFTLSDGSTITLAPAGVVREGEGGALSVLVASPTAPAQNTPFAVWGDGKRVAWRNPGDNTVQVFERSARGAYLPVYVESSLRANSLAFTEDGSTLVAGVIAGGDTELYALQLQERPVALVAKIGGFVSLVPAL